MNSAEAKEAAAELLNEYVDRIDSDRLEDWLELFTEDAIYTIIPRENVEQNLPAALIDCPNKNVLRDRIVSLRNANEYNLHYDRHMVSAIRVRPDGAGEWTLEANYVVYQTTLEGQSKLFGIGRYIDRLRNVNGSLLFCKKYIILDTFSVPTLLATPL